MLVKCSALILAAGYSKRMGEAKACLKMPNGKSFAEHIVKEYIDFGCVNVVLVVNEASGNCLSRSFIDMNPKVQVILNRFPGKGRMHSVRLGLDQISTGHSVFIHNVDNPTIDQQVLVKMWHHRREADWVRPVFRGKGGHPVLISPGMIESILNMEAADIPLSELLSYYQSKDLDVESKSILMNINTREDYEDFFEFCKKKIF